MTKDRKYKKYSNKLDYSYSFGTYATIDMIKHNPIVVECVLVHKKLEQSSLKALLDVCEEHGISVNQNCNKVIERIRTKGSYNVIGIFKKFERKLDSYSNHVVLVNPSDMGNVGTIMRTCLGFGISDIAIVSPAVDVFNPKVVRASMGAIFQINFKYYDSFKEYEENFEERDLYTFILNSAVDLKSLNRDLGKKYSLIFGNESSGLDKSFSKVGQSVYIKHNNKIDSLNLGIAVGIALYHFQ
ncbi:TrmH family RNA methyltransferase [Clostridium sp. D2Q-14]|uniref:TrmH family RNA methyltransferase n=1 Tax=Anaeromonas gelatinilytica TaxID=2683194 RepID=UPI00193C356C|nr:TrmH family RNA methyltransferase [Anaeromonas gelatinilytica]MBS4536688.1 TrmH family RNA methyltransferase [Anaeromonas gelatinilytica]